MSINWKKSISVLAVSCTIFFVGCGGGGTTSGETVDKNPFIGSGGSFKYNRVSIAGSSITWGEGYLGEKSYVGEVEKYLREDVADTLSAGELPSTTTIDEPMSYKGKLYEYDASSEITGNLKASDEITMVYAVKNGVGAVVEMIVDGNSLGDFTISGSNINPVKRIQNVDLDPNTEFRQPFRETNPQAVKTWKLDSNKAHSFKLVVKSGTLLLNFITNHMYYFQNAGVGGFAASDFLKTGVRSTTKEIIDFNPDLFIFESATNDANTWYRESQGGASGATTNVWKTSFRDYSFPDDKKRNVINIAGDISSVVSGDVVIIGSYDGDIRALTVGVVNSVDRASGKVTLIDSLPATLSSNRCRVKSVKSWEDRVQQVVDKVKAGVGHKVVVGIGTSGVPNYFDPSLYPQYEGFSRKLMGYREKGKILAVENNWMFFDFFGKVAAKYPGVDTDKNWSKGDNTHPGNDEGYRLFGSAITDVLKAQ